MLSAAERLAQFPGFLRANGFGVGGGDAVQALRAAERSGLLDRDVLRWSLKALLCRRGDEWQRFDELFDAWFLPANRWQAPERRDPGDGAQSAAHPGGEGEGERADDEDARPRRAASREEALSSADFRTLTEREHALEIEPRDVRAHHALVHVHEMLGRPEEGIRWAGERAEYWAGDSPAAVHNWWHVALFNLALGRRAQALHLLPPAQPRDHLVHRRHREPREAFALGRVDLQALAVAAQRVRRRGLERHVRVRRLGRHALQRQAKPHPVQQVGERGDAGALDLLRAQLAEHER